MSRSRSSPRYTHGGRAMARGPAFVHNDRSCAVIRPVVPMTTALAVMPPPTRRAFLGVECSVTGRFWRDRLDERGAARALTIVQRHGLPELLARVLAGRNVEVDDALAFLDPTVRTLMPDPNTLAGMAAAAARIADAVVRGETVAI